MTLKTTEAAVLYSLWHTFYDQLNGSSSQGWSQFGSIPLSNTFDGNVNPQYKLEIKRGQNASTIASGHKYSFSPAWFSASWDSRRVVGFPYQILETFEGFPLINSLFALDTLPPASVISSVRNRCIAKFIDHCDSHRSSFEAGQDIGEIRETIHSIIHPMASMKNLVLGYLGNVKKLAGKFKHQKVSLHKAVADSFLEFKFGWNPLAGDVADGISGLITNHNHPDVEPVSASARDFYKIQPLLTSNIGSGNVLAYATGQCTGEYQVRYKGAIRTGAVNGRIPPLQQLQLDMPHFLPTLWDLVPYSWMVDYFANVGDIIRAASFQRSNVSWGNVTTRIVCHYDYDYRWEHEYDHTFLNVTMIKPSGHPSGTSTSFSRAPFTGSDLVPDFRFSIPLSEKPWENMAALLTSRLSSTRKAIFS